MCTSGIRGRREASKRQIAILPRIKTYGMAVFVSLLSTSLITSGVQASVTFSMSMEFSGAYAPEGDPPWLTATFENTATPGEVELTLEATNLTDAEFVFECLFNLDPDLDPTELIFSEPVKTGSFVVDAINADRDEFQANGDGFFDIQIDFSNSDGGVNRFGVGEAVMYTITYNDEFLTITEDSFDFTSYQDGGQGTYPTAAHVGGINFNDEYSGWITTPESSTLILLILGCFAFVRRRHRKAPV